MISSLSLFHTWERSVPFLSLPLSLTVIWGGVWLWGVFCLNLWWVLIGLGFGNFFFGFMFGFVVGGWLWGLVSL